jgi:phospholipid/cholesterol/gamma-HCH transport system substrate-binding protein
MRTSPRPPLPSAPPPSPRRVVTWLAVVIVVAFVALLSLLGVTDAADPRAPEATRVHLELPRAVGLYVGDEVQVSGLAAGEVLAVEPELDRVRVTVEVHDVALAGDATASVRLRSLIGERFVELGPAWTGEGEPLADGEVLAGDRARVPAELDEVLASPGEVVEALDGEDVARFVEALDTALDGRRDTVTTMVDQLADVGEVLSAREGELDDGLVRLQRVVGTLAERDEEMGQLLEGSAVVADALMAQEGALSAAIVGLDDLLGETADLAGRQRATLTEVFDALSRVGPVLADREEDFGRVVEELPKFSYGYAQAIQSDGDRWYVVNQPRGLLFLPSGKPVGSGGDPDQFQPAPRIDHSDSELAELTPEELDVTEATGPGPLLPSLRIGPGGVEEVDDDG